MEPGSRGHKTTQAPWEKGGQGSGPRARAPKTHQKAPETQQNTPETRQQNTLGARENAPEPRNSMRQEKIMGAEATKPTSPSREAHLKRARTSQNAPETRQYIPENTRRTRERTRTTKKYAPGPARHRRKNEAGGSRPKNNTASRARRTRTTPEHL